MRAWLWSTRKNKTIRVERLYRHEVDYGTTLGGMVRFVVVVIVVIIVVVIIVACLFVLFVACLFLTSPLFPFFLSLSFPFLSFLVHQWKI